MMRFDLPTKVLGIRANALTRKMFVLQRVIGNDYLELVSNPVAFDLLCGRWLDEGVPGAKQNTIPHERIYHGPVDWPAFDTGTTVTFTVHNRFKETAHFPTIALEAKELRP